MSDLMSETGFLATKSRKILGFLSGKPALYRFAENGAKYQVERSVKNKNLLGTSGSTQPTF